MSKNISKLKKWLAIPGNSTLKLALEMNYKTNATIEQWLKRKSIPEFRIQQLMRIIDVKPNN